MSATPLPERRNPKVPTAQLTGALAKLPAATSYNQEIIHLQLCGYYPDDPDARSLYRAAAEKWGLLKERQGPKLVRPDEPFDFLGEVTRQLDDVAEQLSLDFARRPQLPWPTLADAIGFPLLPWQLWTVAAHSGQGKTTWIMSLVAAWLAEKRRVFLLPLEQGADTTRIYLAALATDLNVGKVLTHRWGDLPADAKDRIAQHLHWQQTEGAELLYLEPRGRITPRELPRLYRRAVEFGAEVFGIDHIHRMAYRSWDEYAAMCASLKELSKTHQLPALITAQMHRGQGPADRLKPYLLPCVDHIQGGKVLEQESDLVLGCYRPLQPDTDPAVLKEIRMGLRGVREYLIPFAVGHVILKNRITGRFGEEVTLRWQDGRVVDPEAEVARHIEEKYDL